MTCEISVCVHTVFLVSETTVYLWKMELNVIMSSVKWRSLDTEVYILSLLLLFRQSDTEPCMFNGGSIIRSQFIPGECE